MEQTEQERRLLRNRRWELLPDELKIYFRRVYINASNAGYIDTNSNITLFLIEVFGRENLERPKFPVGSEIIYKDRKERVDSYDGCGGNYILRDDPSKWGELVRFDILECDAVSAAQNHTIIVYGTDTTTGRGL